jgi:2-keto-4-pentenoate hydratase/2-oxohepta-3-ene-1,7-dioic acid hydratase in catechol pathway
MRIARFAVGDEVRYGVVDGESAQASEPRNGSGTASLTVAEMSGHPFGPGAEVQLTGTRYPVPDVRLLAPVLPTKIVAIGRNYLEHIREMGNEPPSEPLIFLKPSTAVIGPADAIVRPDQLSNRVDFEGELAIVIGRLCRDVPRETCRPVMGNGAGRRASTRSARSGRGSRPTSTPPISSSRPA